MSRHKLAKRRLERSADQGTGADVRGAALMPSLPGTVCVKYHKRSLGGNAHLGSAGCGADDRVHPGPWPGAHSARPGLRRSYSGGAARSSFPPDTTPCVPGNTVLRSEALFSLVSHHTGAPGASAPGAVLSSALARLVIREWIVAVVTLCTRSNPAPSAASGGRYTPFSVIRVPSSPSAVSPMSASSTGNNPPVTPSASQRIPIVTESSRSTGSST